MPHRYAELVAQLEAEIPGFRIVKKDRSRFQRAIHRALTIITFGQQRAYLTNYQTTIGKTVYVTADWDERDPVDNYVTLRHEAVHLRQFKRWTLPGMALLYIFFPLPFGLAWARAAYEKAAYAETIRVTAEVWGLHVVQAPAFRDDIITEFLGPAYGWMWPFRKSMERWYDGVLRELAHPPHAV